MGAHRRGTYTRNKGKVKDCLARTLAEVSGAGGVYTRTVMIYGADVCGYVSMRFSGDWRTLERVIDHRSNGNEVVHN